jgi:hypothetical protein
MSELTLDTAKAVVDAGYRIGACEDPKDLTDEFVVSTAEKLIEIVTQESARDSVHDGVLEIFHAAGMVPESEVSREAFMRKYPDFAPSSNGHAKPEQSTSDAFAQPTNESEAPASSPAAEKPDSEDIDAIFGGVSYDGFSADQIVNSVLGSAAIGDLLVEEWYAILEYEKATKARQEILSLRPTFKEDEAPATREEKSTIAKEQTSVEFFAGGAKEESSKPQSSVEILAKENEETKDDGDSIEAYYNGETISRAQQAGLPTPPAPEGNRPPHLPINIDEVSSEELTRIATAYHSWYSHTQWLLAQEEGREKAADHLAREAHKDAYVQAFELHKQEIPEGKSGPTAVDNARKLADKDADIAGPVRKYRSRAVRHSIEAGELKALALGFEKSGWRINEEMNRRIALAKHSHTAK